ncbi:hypothetical protein Pmani_028476 [Petrolisthes manimaculis]|uniref:Uncharacterized protein n=1 Tax=Petrolisthes manimaculis TaxID=1843537 RepID=A0AAE1TY03_9EUCA|nr:hypothetical protein Pmani_028476 [Petrolisthes manimaculis]
MEDRVKREIRRAFKAIKQNKSLRDRIPEPSKFHEKPPSSRGIPPIVKKVPNHLQEPPASPVTTSIKRDPNYPQKPLVFRGTLSITREPQHQEGPLHRGPPASRGGPSHASLPRPHYARAR